MELRPELTRKIRRLTEKGVRFVHPSTVDIGDEVDTERISGHGVVIHPGCRIYGPRTVVSAGTAIGREQPATIEDCQLGPRVELGGGYFAKSVFLDGCRIGSGAQVREGCLLEEQAVGAHCVGLKQTILFPFVTLGSLVNFCDVLLAGGTSRRNHSEVGSSFVHFNFTPQGDKATASLLGDVPRGVMLDQPPIFLGGQGGIVGPARLGFGNVLAAGTVLRRDILAEGKLVFEASHPKATKTFRPRSYPRLARTVRNNVTYVANLVALEQWYVHVRRRFFEEQELGLLVYEGAMEVLASAIDERCRRLMELAQRAASGRRSNAALRQQLVPTVDRLRKRLQADEVRQSGQRHRDAFLAGLDRARRPGVGYVDTIQSLPPEVARTGTKWLATIVAAVTKAWA